MKSGANYVDQGRIRDLQAEGNSAEDVSNMLQIELSCIESFFAHFSGTPQPGESNGPARSELSMDLSKDVLLGIAHDHEVELDEADTKAVIIEKIEAHWAAVDAAAETQE